MSRLQEHRQKQFQKKLVFFGGISLLLVIVIFVFGFKLLISASLFISHLTSSQKNTPTTTEDTFYGDVTIDSIPTATNSAQIMVSGSVVNYSQLDFYINDNKVKNIDSLASDNFNEQVGDLQKGSNTVYVKASSKDHKHTKTSQSFTVVYKNDKPKLDVTNPSGDGNTDKSDLTVSGKTDVDTYIKVNDLPVVVDAQGNFQTAVRLKDGDNKITVVAQDDAGNSDQKQFTITYHAS